MLSRLKIINYIIDILRNTSKNNLCKIVRKIYLSSKNHFCTSHLKIILGDNGIFSLQEFAHKF
jgi:hypothetical protein